MKRLKRTKQLGSSIVILLLAGLLVSASAKSEETDSVIVTAKGQGVITTTVEKAKITNALVVLRKDGTVVVYEDIPQSLWDRIPLWIHNRKWESRTGPCTFRSGSEWRSVFNSFGFEIVAENPHSRWSYLLHPVTHMQYVLRYNEPKSLAVNN